MDLTKLGFVMLVMAFFIIAAASFMGDMVLQYPAIATYTPSLANYSATMNTTILGLSGNFSAARDYAKDFTVQDNPIAGAFGYLFGAVNAAVTLVTSTPTLFMASIMMYFSLLGPFGASLGWLLALLNVAVGITIVVGLIYMLLKVK